MPPVRFLDIRWSTRDPDALVARLRGSGFTVESGRVVAFPSATIGIDAGTSSTDRLEIDEGSALPGEPPGPHPNGVEDVLAIGWATVDRERFVAGLGLGAVEQLPRRSAPRGIRRPARAGATGDPDRRAVGGGSPRRHARPIGRGPDRHLPGPRPGELDAFAAAARPGGVAVSSVRAGPLGPSVILQGGRIWDPAVVLVAR